MKKTRMNSFVAVLIVCILLVGVLIPIVQAFDTENIKGFDKGPSSKPVVAMKKTTLVRYDKDGVLDDYAYLAAIPTAVFNYDNKLFSHPLLFYEDEYKWEEDRERSLNPYQGVDYFMEDWMSYSNGELDQKILINMDENDASKWDAKETITIKANNPYEIASKIALQDWSYTDDAVIAVIDSFEKYNEKTEGQIEGSFSIDKEIKTVHFTVPQTNKLNPQFNEFTVPEGYTYLQARIWYSSLLFSNPIFRTTIPSGDKDLQLYCEHNGDWMQVAAVDAWNAKSGMDTDYARTYVYKTGPWLCGVTDVPTKGITRYGTWSEILSNIIKGVQYKIDIEMYPGAEIPFKVDIPFYCRDIEFELKCNNNDDKFEFLLIGQNGEKILDGENGVIKLNQLGESLPDKNYQFAIYTKEDVSGTFNYEISYSWNQNKTRDESDSLTSATEGAVLASTLNAPLLYVSPSNIPKVTEEVLYKLGVENIYLLNLGDHLEKDTKDEIKNIVSIKKEYIEYKDIYTSINEISGNIEDIVFSTIDPWTHWYVAELKPAGEFLGELFIGPAAYIAAHHGSPVLIVDNHPELSSACAWHTESWRRKPNGYSTPTVSEMYLTGTGVYEFLEEYGLDSRETESIITVAGQFDIGASWDRMFVGQAVPGRFTFSPVDTAYWISRNVFYPAIIFENPAMDPSGIELINGSKSTRGPLGRLKIIRQSGYETFEYPILHSFMPVYIHRFNERASKYWGFTYQCANGVTPGLQNTFEPIDDGVNLIHTGEAGSFWPDLSETDYVPFYMSRCGYSNAFSTSFEPVMENLNKGCLMWIVGTHGNSLNSGEFVFHDPDSILHSGEANPWRGYEWYLGSTEEPDTMTMEVHGIIPMLLGNPDMDGIIRTALDFAPAKKPLMDAIGRIASLPILRKITPEWLQDTEDYYDGIVGSSFFSLMGTTTVTGLQIDDAIDNIHSCGLITAACLPAYKYLHLAMVRHGSNFQVIDPWGTSWYSSFWEATIPRDIALGDTVGEAYAKGMGYVGILYISDPPQWWWDKAENVCYYGDPDLRVFTPGTEYSDNNYWTEEETQPIKYDEELNLAGHMPYGATSYPHEKEPDAEIPLWAIILIAVILVLIVVAGAVRSDKKNKKK